MCLVGTNALPGFRYVRELFLGECGRVAAGFFSLYFLFGLHSSRLWTEI